MGIFDNVNSVTINDKEVQSIVISSNGAIIYEKSGSSKIATEIILSQRVNQALNMMKLQDVNGNGLGGKEVKLYYDGEELSSSTTSTKSGRVGTFVMQNSNHWCVKFEGDNDYESCIYMNP